VPDFKRKKKEGFFVCSDEHLFHILNASTDKNPDYAENGIYVDTSMVMETI